MRGWGAPNTPHAHRRALALSGRVLVRFVELGEKSRRISQNSQPRTVREFWIKTAYLADIFSLYNETNKRLQGAESNIMQCKEALDAFVCKLEYRVGKMEKGELQQFPLLLKQCRNYPETIPVAVRRVYQTHERIAKGDSISVCWHSWLRIEGIVGVGSLYRKSRGCAIPWLWRRAHRHPGQLSVKEIFPGRPMILHSILYHCWCLISLCARANWGVGHI